jgi:hypothetical protein
VTRSAGMQRNCSKQRTWRSAEWKGEEGEPLGRTGYGGSCPRHGCRVQENAWCVGPGAKEWMWPTSGPHSKEFPDLNNAPNQILGEGDK